jgi:hypothetical protein
VAPEQPKASSASGIAKAASRNTHLIDRSTAPDRL